MADTLYDLGKVEGMKGIEASISSLILRTSAGVLITNTGATTSDFATNGTTGQLANTSAIDFDVLASDVGLIVFYVDIQSASGPMVRVDLSPTVTLTTEGTATFAIGDLTAIL